MDNIPMQKAERKGTYVRLAQVGLATADQIAWAEGISVQRASTELAILKLNEKTEYDAKNGFWFVT